MRHPTLARPARRPGRPAPRLHRKTIAGGSTTFSMDHPGAALSGWHRRPACPGRRPADRNPNGRTVIVTQRRCQKPHSTFSQPSLRLSARHPLPCQLRFEKAWQPKPPSSQTFFTFAFLHFGPQNRFYPVFTRLFLRSDPSFLTCKSSLRYGAAFSQSVLKWSRERKPKPAMCGCWEEPDGVLECWSVGEMVKFSHPSLHHSITPVPIPPIKANQG